MKRVMVVMVLAAFSILARSDQTKPNRRVIRALQQSDDLIKISSIQTKSASLVSSPGVELFNQYSTRGCGTALDQPQTGVIHP